MTLYFLIHFLILPQKLFQTCSNLKHQFLCLSEKTAVTETSQLPAIFILTTLKFTSLAQVLYSELRHSCPLGCPIDTKISMSKSNLSPPRPVPPTGFPVWRKGTVTIHWVAKPEIYPCFLTLSFSYVQSVKSYQSRLLISWLYYIFTSSIFSIPSPPSLCWLLYLFH